MPMPVTASGGTRATAIAVPGRASLRFGFALAKAVANPATMAMMRKMIAGSVREKISVLFIVVSYPFWKNQVNTAAKPIAQMVDLSRVSEDQRMSLLSDMTTPRESERIGERMGAMSIEPMTTAPFWAITPSVAMTVERMTKRKKDGRGEESWIRSSMAVTLSFSLILLKSMLMQVYLRIFQ